MSHRFAAVLAADVAGYSRLMETDSERTVQALKDCREIFQRCVTEHHGREFGSVGDSLMAEFASPVEALRAAQCIQKDLAALNEGDVDDDRLQIRIGLHAGDVISDGESLFGDVVNTAARLQQIAQPGGIALSGLIHEQVKYEHGFGFRPLGQQILKNIAEPITVYEVERQHRRINSRRIRLAILPYRVAIAATLGVLIAGAFFIAYLEYREEPGIGSTIDIPSDSSIAVVPFRSQGTDEHDALLVAGMHVDILTQLAKIGAFDKVISRTSMEQYRNADIPVLRIAQELQVSKILAGSVQRAGDKARINVELIDAETSSSIWTESYDRDLTVAGVFNVQSDIARSVANALQLVVTADESNRLSSIPTDNIDAYGEFVKGQQQMSRLTIDSMRKAVAHFEQAIELDSTYADAYLGLAEALAVQRGYVFDPLLKNTRQPQRDAIDKALELDPFSAGAFSALALLHMADKDYEQAEPLFLRAIELNSNLADAHFWYSVLLRHEDRLDEAITHSRKALELVPEPPPLYQLNVSRQLFDIGEEEAAITLLLESVRANPEFVYFYYDLSRQLSHTGKLGDALRWANEGVRMDPSHRYLFVVKCRLHLNLGDAAAAERCNETLEHKHGWRPLVEQMGTLLLQDDIDGLVELNKQNAGRDDLSAFGHFNVGVAWVLLNQAEKARPIWESMGPEMFGDADVSITRDNVALAVHIGCTLQADGRFDRADYLIDRGMEVIKASWRKNSFRRIFEIGVHVCRGDRQGAVKELRTALDENWLMDWWQLRYPFFVDAMHSEPEWQALVSELEANIAAERQWFEEHKDEPLF